MGLKKTLAADQNFMGLEFKDAYWKLYNLGFGDDGGGRYIVYAKLKAFPSREAASRTDAYEKVGAVPELGGSKRPMYEAELYNWTIAIPVEYVFPSGIPSDYNEAKTIMYKYIKEFKSSAGFEDVLEEGNSTEVQEKYIGTQKTEFDQLYGGLPSKWIPVK